MIHLGMSWGHFEQRFDVSTLLNLYDAKMERKDSTRKRVYAGRFVFRRDFDIKVDSSSKTEGGRTNTFLLGSLSC